MRRWAGRRFRGKRRSTSWLAGISTYDVVSGNSSRLVSLTNAGFAAATQFGATIGVVTNADLPPHGGEDSVLTRVVGRLGFMEGRRNAGAGFAAFGFQMRVALVQVSQVAGSAVILTDDLLSSAGMGKENILWQKDVVVPSLPIGNGGAGYDTAAGGMERWLEIDVRAQRRITEDMPVLLWFQTCFVTPTTAVDFRLLGGLRSLLKRPR